MSVITWKVAQLERKLPDGDTCPDGAVYTVHYTISCEEAGKTAGAYGSIGLGDPSPSDFTPFASLTEDQVIGWVKTTLGSEQVASVEAALEQQIQQELNPTTATGVPW